jgi:hypothetical protein
MIRTPRRTAQSVGDLDFSNTCCVSHNGSSTDDICLPLGVSSGAAGDDFLLPQYSGDDRDRKTCCGRLSAMFAMETSSGFWNDCGKERLPPRGHAVHEISPSPN